MLNLEPASLMRWIDYVQTANVAKLLVHPRPLLDAGFGACADGICVNAQTTRRDQTYPDGAPNFQPVADYEGHEWDPETCSGPSDDPATRCGGKTIEEWNDQNRDPAIEPGVQIFEDPDAQASPEFVPYPLPAIYVGTCGVILGGGDVSFPPMAPSQPGAPYVNSAGQIIIPTGCDETSDSPNSTPTPTDTPSPSPTPTPTIACTNKSGGSDQTNPGDHGNPTGCENPGGQ